MSWRIAACSCAVLIGAAACGGGGSGRSSGPDQAERLAGRAGLEAQAVVDGVCDGWATDHPDRPTVNEYVHDLLLPLDLVNGPTPPSFTTDQIDALVVEACRDYFNDLSGFVAHVRDGLELTEADLDERVASACARYDLQQRRIAEGDWSGEDIGQMIRMLAEDHGVGLASLRDAVSAVCAEP